MTFTPIDPTAWPRIQTFYYFSQMAPTGYSLTVELDVTALRQTLKSRGLKFYPTYLWLVTKNLNADPAFRLAKQGERIGFYDCLTPLYAVFHEDDNSFSMMWTEFDQDFSVFYRIFMENQTQYGANHGFLAQPETPPPANAYTVPAFPGSPFSTSPSTAMRKRTISFRQWKQENSSFGMTGAFCTCLSPAITPLPMGIM